MLSLHEKKKGRKEKTTNIIFQNEKSRSVFPSYAKKYKPSLFPSSLCKL
jgi:hypothetical protein